MDIFYKNLKNTFGKTSNIPFIETELLFKFQFL
jgi:hypothetical protein